MAERFNLAWLKEGVGAPFVVYRVIDDDEAVAFIKERCGDQALWGSMFCTADNERFVLIASHTVSFSKKDQGVRYHMVEVVSGNIGIEAIRRLYADGFCRCSFSVSDDEFERLATGYMGNNELLGFEDKRKSSHGQMNRVKSVDGDVSNPYHWLANDAVPAPQQFKVSEQTYQYGQLSDGDLLMKVMTAVDKVLAETGLVWPDEKKRAFTALMFENARHSGKALDLDWLRRLAVLMNAP